MDGLGKMAWLPGTITGASEAHKDTFKGRLFVVVVSFSPFICYSKTG